MPNKKTILLVEDNKDDEILALRAMRKNNIANTISSSLETAKRL